MSPTGGDVFPYVTPANAATSLVNALAAAGDGDSLLVETTTYIGSALTVDEGIAMYGAWNSNFTSRDLASGKTTIDLNSTINVISAAPVRIDGFIIQDGGGSPQLPPVAGDYGGGIFALNANLTVANCELRANVLSSGGTYGAGGGVYASGSVVDFHDNVFADNEARQGGAIYLDNCSGSLSDNAFTDNQIRLATGSPGGGALYVVNSSSLSVVDNTFDGNSSNDGSSPSGNGGAVHVKSSTGVALSGGTFSYNTTSANGSGGGVYIDSAAVTISGVVFDRNQSTFFGGAVSCNGASIMSMTECDVLWNTSLLGGGVYASTGVEAFIDHNLFVGNGATVSAGGCYFLSPAGGSFIGNTMDRNTSSSTGGVCSPMLRFRRLIILS